MMVSIDIHGDAVHGIAAVVEDEAVEVRLKEVLSDAGLEVHTVNSTIDLQELIKKTELDVASIDWELNEFHCGEDLIRMVRQSQPETACVVYTKHAYVLEHAKTSEAEVLADKYLLKTELHNLEEYSRAMLDGVRLGLARRIVTSLGRLGEPDLPGLKPGSALDSDAEQVVFERSRLCLRQKLRHPQAPSNGEISLLTNCLRRRGWWRAFDEDFYLALDWGTKLQYLLRFVDVNEDQLGKMVGVDASGAKSLLDGEPDFAATELDKAENARSLISVLGYLVELTQYEPELINEVWHEKGMFRESVCPPPWSGSNLFEYLSDNGPTGIANSVTWIRSH